MKNMIMTALLMALCYAMHCIGIVYRVDNVNMMVGAICLMGSSWAAGSVFATERFRNLLADILDDIKGDADGEE